MHEQQHAPAAAWLRLQLPGLLPTCITAVVAPPPLKLLPCCLHGIFSSRGRAKSRITQEMTMARKNRKLQHDQTCTATHTTCHYRCHSLKHAGTVHTRTTQPQQQNSGVFDSASPVPVCHASAALHHCLCAARGRPTSTVACCTGRTAGHVACYKHPGGGGGSVLLLSQVSSC